MRRKNKPLPARSEITVTVEGKTFTGSYYVESGVVTVIYGDKQPNSSQTGGTPAEHVARMLLKEIVDAEIL